MKPIVIILYVVIVALLLTFLFMRQSTATPTQQRLRWILTAVGLTVLAATAIVFALLQ